MLIQKIFAKNLKDRMHEKNFSQAQLSRATGLSRSAICQYLSGQNMPGDKALHLIAKALDTTEVRLLLTEDEDVSLPETNIAVATAAKLMGVGQEFIRAGLRQGRLPFGTAVKVSGTKYTYYISPVKFAEYTGLNTEVAT